MEIYRKYYLISLCLVLINFIFYYDLPLRRIKDRRLLQSVIVLNPSIAQSLLQEELKEFGGEDFLRFLEREASELKKELVKRLGTTKLPDITRIFITHKPSSFTIPGYEAGWVVCDRYKDSGIFQWGTWVFELPQYAQLKEYEFDSHGFAYAIFLNLEELSKAKQAGFDIPILTKAILCHEMGHILLGLPSYASEEWRSGKDDFARIYQRVSQAHPLIKGIEFDFARLESISKSLIAQELCEVIAHKIGAKLLGSEDYKIYLNYLAGKAKGAIDIFKLYEYPLLFFNRQNIYMLVAVSEEMELNDTAAFLRKLHRESLDDVLDEGMIQFFRQFYRSIKFR